MKFSLHLKLTLLIITSVLTPFAVVSILGLSFPLSLVPFIISAALASFALFLALRPLSKFVEASKVLSGGNLNFKLNIKSHDELEEVADAFNLMSDKLGTSFQKIESENNSIYSERNRFNAVLSSVIDGIIALDFNKNVIFVNKAAEGITGLTQTQLFGKPLSQFVHFFDGGEEIVAPTYCDPSFNKSVMLSSEGGSQIKVYLSTSKIEGENQQGCLLILHDLSKEEELEQMKLDFVSMASHELKTPLTSIIGYLSVFINENKGKVANEDLNLLEKSLISAQQLYTLIQNILNVNKIERDQMAVSSQAVDYQPILTKVTEDLRNQAQQKNITLNLNLPAEVLPKVIADPIRISEVITNLAANAINYTNPGGRVDITAQVSPSEITTIVSDTGIGIPADALPNLFNKFFRVSNTKQQSSKGTGLGLYIAKEIITKLNGKIWVESEAGQGSKFYFTLPITSEIKTFPQDNSYVHQAISQGALNY